MIPKVICVKKKKKNKLKYEINNKVIQKKNFFWKMIPKLICLKKKKKKQ